MDSMFEKMFGKGGMKSIIRDGRFEVEVAATETKNKLPKKETIKKAGKKIISGLNTVRRYAQEYRESTGLPEEYHPFMVARPEMFGGQPRPRPPPKQQPRQAPKKQPRSRSPQHYMHSVKREPEKESEEQRKARERKRYDELIRKNPDINRAYALKQAQMESERK